MARQPNRTPAQGRTNGPAFNPARAAAERLRPQIDDLHRQAERVADDRQRLIESITDRSLRNTVR
ncbi:hypothetical protein [Phenylobacterium sp.]|uniref:hypothetical protein n=1 Tax=Phenylobacterium sp. TaxID=1871053 RepID=UPI0035AFA4D9